MCCHEKNCPSSGDPGAEIAAVTSELFFQATVFTVPHLLPAESEGLQERLQVFTRNGIKVAGPDPLVKVKRIALVAAAAALLAGCQSSQEFCAEYKAGDAKNAQALKKLGLKQERNWFYSPQRFEKYCQ